MLCLMLAVGAHRIPSRSLATQLGWSAPLALVLAMALAVNFTLAISFLPVIAAILVWLMCTDNWTVRQGLTATAFTLAISLVISLPLLPGHLKAFGPQTVGGGSLPFPTPLSLVGQQLDLGSIAASPPQLGLWWGLTISAVVAATAIFARRSIDKTMLLSLMLGSTLLVLALIVIYGADDYLVFKWLALFVAVAIPIMTAGLVAQLAGNLRQSATVAAAVLSVSALAIASAAGYRVGNVVPEDLLALSGNAQLAEVDVLNVDLGSPYLDSIGGMLPPSREVRVVTQTYSPASPPIGDLFLIDSSAPAGREWADVQQLSGPFAIARLDLELSAGRVDFGADSRPSLSHLFGTWSVPEEPGAWSTPGTAYVVFDVANSLGEDSVTVTITGYPYAFADHPRSIDFLVNGEVALTVSSRSADEKSYRLTISRSEIARANGRVVVGIRSDEGLSPTEVGLADTRQLVFFLKSMDVEAG
jgi:hypothetical protein